MSEGFFKGFRVLIERDGKRLLYIEGEDTAQVEAAVQGVFERQRADEPKAKRAMTRLSDAESEALVVAIRAGRMGRQLRQVLPNREVATIKSHVLALARNGKLFYGDNALTVHDIHDGSFFSGMGS